MLSLINDFSLEIIICFLYDNSLIVSWICSCCPNRLQFGCHGISLKCGIISVKLNYKSIHLFRQYLREKFVICIRNRVLKRTNTTEKLLLVRKRIHLLWKNWSNAISRNFWFIYLNSQTHFHQTFEVLCNHGMVVFRLGKHDYNTHYADVNINPNRHVILKNIFTKNEVFSKTVKNSRPDLRDTVW